MKVEDVQT